MVMVKIINIHILIMAFSVSAVKHSHGIEDLNMYLNFKKYYTASIYYYKLIITLLKIEKKSNNNKISSAERYNGI